VGLPKGSYPKVFTKAAPRHPSRPLLPKYRKKKRRNAPKASRKADTRLAEATKRKEDENIIIGDFGEKIPGEGERGGWRGESKEAGRKGGKEARRG
jgi:hypothetical protein